VFRILSLFKSCLVVLDNIVIETPHEDIRPGECLFYHPSTYKSFFALWHIYLKNLSRLLLIIVIKWENKTIFCDALVIMTLPIGIWSTTIRRYKAIQGRFVKNITGIVSNNSHERQKLIALWEDIANKHTYYFFGCKHNPTGRNDSWIDVR